MKVYNAIFDYALSANAVKVYLYLTRCQNALGTAAVKVSTISDKCAIQSAVSVHKAIAELEEKGLVSKYRRRCADGDYIANGYHITQLQGRWFSLSLKHNPFALPKNSFLVYLYMLRCANRAGRAWPSLRRMAEVLAVSKNTVLNAIQQLICGKWLRKCLQWAGKHNLYVLGQGSTSEESVCAETKKDDAAGEPHHQTSNSAIHHKSRFLAFIISKAQSAVNIGHKKVRIFLDRVVQKLYSSIIPSKNYQYRKKE